MSNEIVKYHNDMNRVPFRKFNAVELDLFFAICSKVRDEGLNEVSYSFDELRLLSKYSKRNNRLFGASLVTTYEKMLSTVFSITQGSKVKYFTLFNYFEVDHEQETVMIRVNQDFKYILNELTANFTRFELEEFAEVKSTYSKTMYRLLKQFRTTGYYKVHIDEFRHLLDVPKSYRMKDIDKVVLKPINLELSSKFKNLRVKKLTVKKGRKIEYLEFLFDTEEVPRKRELEPIDYQTEQVEEQISFDEFEEMLKR